MFALNRQIEEVIEQVKSWPDETRIALARRVLETLEPAFHETKPRKVPSVDEFLGLWSTGGPAPTDEECEQILVEELERKYSP